MSSLTQYPKVKLTNLVTTVFTFSLRRQTTGQFFHITVVNYILCKIIKFVKNIAICNTSLLKPFPYFHCGNRSFSFYYNVYAAIFYKTPIIIARKTSVLNSFACPELSRFYFLTVSFEIMSLLFIANERLFRDILNR